MLAITVYGNQVEAFKNVDDDIYYIVEDSFTGLYQNLSDPF